ncbi:hypothetical protein BV25DRAFT_1916957 [Artomyces pyxidatus]|uniref:Uncharacterized protein n=1 Tax=Artomyces pyxidatus TaxID=48021 RepID=A0ACB8SZ94_9AGAM|nr:hypothetical protein BV25DRAFT_1916957 [Artomyces pyxidatus]
MEGLEALRTRIQSAADELGVQELAQCVDGELPPGASMDSPYTKLYDLLRPAFDYQRTPVDPVEPHPDTALAAARSSTPSQYLPDTEKQGVLQTQSSAPPSPVPHGPSRGSSVSSKRKLDEESQ